MITLKIKVYSDEEIQMMYDVLGEGLAMVMSVNCIKNCFDCQYKHICRDLDETQEFIAEILESRRGK